VKSPKAFASGINAKNDVTNVIDGDHLPSPDTNATMTKIRRTLIFEQGSVKTGYSIFG
jgi:hypothetical protein